MKFIDDESLECYQCEKTISPGEEYYLFREKNFCSEECLGAAMVDEFYNEVRKCYLMTKEDKESEYGDTLYRESQEEI